jgi:hypothetical protein
MARMGEARQNLAVRRMSREGMAVSRGRMVTVFPFTGPYSEAEC